MYCKFCLQASNDVVVSDLVQDHWLGARIAILRTNVDTLSTTEGLARL